MCSQRISLRGDYTCILEQQRKISHTIPTPGNLWTNCSSCINRISSMCRTGITRGGSGKCKSIMLCAVYIGLQVDVTVFMIEAVARSMANKRDGDSSSKPIGTKDGKG